jgi:hypothetical protein
MRQPVEKSPVGGDEPAVVVESEGQTEAILGEMSQLHGDAGAADSRARIGTISMSTRSGTRAAKKRLQWFLRQTAAVNACPPNEA